MKKLLAFLLALTMVLTLAACGSDPVPTGTTEATKPETTPSEVTEPQLVTAYALDTITVRADGVEAVVSFTFDERGLLHNIEMRANGELQNQIKTEFDENGDPTVATTYGPDNKEISKIEYVSVENGKVNESLETSNGKTIREVSIRDDAGNLIEKKQYDEDGGLIGSTKYEYDDLGHPAKEIVLNGDGKETQIKEYHCDRDGNLTEYCWKTGLVVTYEICHYLYTYEDGRLTQRTSQTENGIDFAYRYDEAGNLVEITTDGGTVTLLYNPMELSEKDAQMLEETVGSFLEGAFILT